MNIQTAEEKLKNRITEALKDVKLLNPDGEYVPIRVYTGLTPPTNVLKELAKQENDLNEQNKKNYNEFPLLAVRVISGSDKNHHSMIKFKLTIITFSEDKNLDKSDVISFYQGHYDVIAIIETLRINFLENIVIDEYQLENKFEWKTPEEQPHPYFVGTIDLEMNIPTIASKVGFA